MVPTVKRQRSYTFGPEHCLLLHHLYVRWWTSVDIHHVLSRWRLRSNLKVDMDLRAYRFSGWEVMCTYFQPVTITMYYESFLKYKVFAISTEYILLLYSDFFNFWFELNKSLSHLCWEGFISYNFIVIYITETTSIITIIIIIIILSWFHFVSYETR